MTWITKPSRRWAACILTAASFVCVGCSTPASVSPLLQVTERVLLGESDRIGRDIAIEKAHTDQTLSMLASAYRKDLDEAEALTPAWVDEATSAYVAAREAVIENETKRIAAHQTRAENLRSAMLAARRARQLLDRQDQLLQGIVGDDLTRLMNDLNPPIGDDHE